MTVHAARVQLRLDENPTFSEGVEEERAGDAAPFLGLLPAIEDQIDRYVEPSKRPAEARGLRTPAIEVRLDNDQIQLAVVAGTPSAWPKENNFRPRRNLGQPASRFFDQGLIDIGQRQWS